ncbi:hypothetical protein EYZ11_011621 [Aspergillus tanneri]|uniref:Mid2 domain-containing protein n=1 Tax=Aspergillus tanneri TaxID=1220188 RepID=A0A4S3J2C1_9EURO|nr:uncharacterized protein ATNIH1004_005235 [Aspergillus tanneri]KAA8649334.1 hypothetical protein ATNIH1004_005235 [Aspergillus tanneri]THC88930.1 hypothetical protein EYZ11_011621 [Aspergillus tanneri]
MHLTLSFYLVALLPTVCGKTDANNYFINPSSNTGIAPVWTLGDQQVISWKTTLEVFNISMWQQSLVQQSAASQGNVYSKIHASDKVTNFTWTVQLYGFDLDYSNVFFFWVNSDTPEGFPSTYFNITKPTSTQTATTSTSVSPSTTSSIDSSSSVSSHPDAASQSSSHSDAASQSASPSGIPTTGKIALGVGIGIGVPVLAALGALVWLKARAPRTFNERVGNHVPVAPERAMQRPAAVHYKSPIEMPGTVPEMSGNTPATIFPEMPTQRDQ